MQVYTYVQPLNSRTTHMYKCKNKTLTCIIQTCMTLVNGALCCQVIHIHLFVSTISHIRMYSTYHSIGTRFHHSTVQSSHVRSSILNAHFFTNLLCNSTQTHIRAYIHLTLICTHHTVLTCMHTHTHTHMHTLTYACIRTYSICCSITLQL